MAKEEKACDWSSDLKKMAKHEGDGKSLLILIYYAGMHLMNATLVEVDRTFPKERYVLENPCEPGILLSLTGYDVLGWCLA